MLQRVTSPEPAAGATTTETRTPSTYPRSVMSRANSAASSYLTGDTSLPALQTRAAGDEDALEPLVEEEIEPGSFDLVVPGHGDGGLYSLERRSELLFSRDHLAVVFADPALLQRFTNFLCASRPASLPLADLLPRRPQGPPRHRLRQRPDRRPRAARRPRLLPPPRPRRR